MIVTLDYGQISKELPGDNWAVGNIVRRIYVGGVPRAAGSTSLVLNGLTGCVEVNFRLTYCKFKSGKFVSYQFKFKMFVFLFIHRIFE